MIIRPESRATQSEANRLLWWVEGWCNLVDGISMILSAGFYSPLLANKFANWRLERALRDPFALTKDLTQDQLSRFKARVIAKKLWKIDPKHTITYVSGMMTVHEVSKRPDGSYYSTRTIREWIKDLCPDRSPGRRPNG